MRRLELLRQLRAGEIDVIVGVNLLREVRTLCHRVRVYFVFAAMGHVFFFPIWSYAYPIGF